MRCEDDIVGDFSHCFHKAPIIFPAGSVTLDILFLSGYRACRKHYWRSLLKTAGKVTDTSCIIIVINVPGHSDSTSDTDTGTRCFTGSGG